ncbi:MAG: leucine-rich repeat protein, partial [Christensenellaceae bacterium]|nr:leucine-rich repeat protein [Christensenellaceae bacterium]
MPLRKKFVALLLLLSVVVFGAFVFTACKDGGVAERIEIHGTYKTEYIAGESFSVDGMVIEVYLSNNKVEQYEAKDIIGDLTLRNTGTNQLADDQVVQIEYKGKTAEVHIKVVSLRSGEHKHTIVFVTGENAEAVENQYISEGGTVTEVESPRKNGKFFDGWYTDETYSTKYAFTTPVSFDITLYAKWGNIIVVNFAYYTGKPNDPAGTFAYQAPLKVEAEEGRVLSLVKIPLFTDDYGFDMFPGYTGSWDYSGEWNDLVNGQTIYAKYTLNNYGVYLVDTTGIPLKIPQNFTYGNNVLEDAEVFFRSYNPVAPENKEIIGWRVRGTEYVFPRSDIKDWVDPLTGDGAITDIGAAEAFLTNVTHISGNVYLEAVFDWLKFTVTFNWNLTGASRATERMVYGSILEAYPSVSTISGTSTLVRNKTGADFSSETVPANYNQSNYIQTLPQKELLLWQLDNGDEFKFGTDKVMDDITLTAQWSDLVIVEFYNETYTEAAAAKPVPDSLYLVKYLKTLSEVPVAESNDPSKLALWTVFSATLNGNGEETGYVVNDATELSYQNVQGQIINGRRYLRFEKDLRDNVFTVTFLPSDETSSVPFTWNDIYTYHYTSGDAQDGTNPKPAESLLTRLVVYGNMLAGNTITNPEVLYYNFDGWRIKGEAVPTPRSYATIAALEITQNYEFVASFTRQQVTLTYDYTKSYTTPHSDSVQTGRGLPVSGLREDVLYVMQDNTDISEQMREFEFWATDPDATIRYTGAPITQNTTLYAHWTDVFTIQFRYYAYDVQNEPYPAAADLLVASEQALFYVANGKTLNEVISKMEADGRLFTDVRTVPYVPGKTSYWSWHSVPFNFDVAIGQNYIGDADSVKAKYTDVSYEVHFAWTIDGGSENFSYVSGLKYGQIIPALENDPAGLYPSDKMEYKARLDALVGGSAMAGEYPRNGYYIENWVGWAEGLRVSLTGENTIVKFTAVLNTRDVVVQFAVTDLDVRNAISSSGIFLLGGETTIKYGGNLTAPYVTVSETQTFDDVGYRWTGWNIPLTNVLPQPAGAGVTVLSNGDYYVVVSALFNAYTYTIRFTDEDNITYARLDNFPFNRSLTGVLTNFGDDTKVSGRYGESDFSSNSTAKAEIGTAILNVTTPPFVSKTGYDFKGWYTTTQYVFEANFGEAVKRNYTFYAKFEIKKFEVVFDLGAYGDEVNWKNRQAETLPLDVTQYRVSESKFIQDVNYGFRVIRPVTDPLPSAANSATLAFGGWFFGSGRYDFNSFIQNVATGGSQTITLEAVWITKTEGTAGLVYEYNDATGEAYVKSKGTASAAHIVIPSNVVNPANFKSYTVTQILNSAFTGQTGITEVTIPVTIINIGQDAFAGTRLTEIVFPYSVERIAEGAFRNIPTLQTVVFDESSYDSMLNYIGKDAFAYATSLVSVTLPVYEHPAYGDIPNVVPYHVNPAQITIDDRAFLDCFKLSKMILHENVVSLGHKTFSFSDNAGLRYVKFESNFAPASQTDTFEGTPLYFKIYVPTVTTSYEEADFNATINAELQLLEWNNSSANAKSKVVIDVDGDLVYSYKARTIGDNIGITLLQYLDTETVYDMDAINALLDAGKKIISVENYAFDGTITEIVFPLSIVFAENALLAANSLTTISVTDDIESVPAGTRQVLTNAFFNLPLLNTFAVKTGTNTQTGIFGTSGAPARLINLIIREGSTVVPERMFENAGIESIIIPASLVRIGAYAFKGNSQLNQILFPNTIVLDAGGNTGVTAIGEEAFQNCYVLDISGITYYGYVDGVLVNNNVPISLGFPSSVTTIGHNAVFNTKLLNTYQVHHYYNSISGIVYTAETISGSVEAVPFVILGGGVLYSYVGKAGIGNVEFLPEKFVYLDFKYHITKINDYAFYGDNNIVMLIAESESAAKNELVSIGRSAFENASKLEDVVLNVPNLKTIESRAFMNASRLGKMIVLGIESTPTVEADTFAGNAATFSTGKYASAAFSDFIFRENLNIYSGGRYVVDNTPDSETLILYVGGGNAVIMSQLILVSGGSGMEYITIKNVDSYVFCSEVTGAIVDVNPEYDEYAFGLSSNLVNGGVFFTDIRQGTGNPDLRQSISSGNRKAFARLLNINLNLTRIGVTPRFTLDEWFGVGAMPSRITAVDLIPIGKLGGNLTRANYENITIVVKNFANGYLQITDFEFFISNTVLDTLSSYVGIASSFDRDTDYIDVDAFYGTGYYNNQKVENAGLVTIPYGIGNNNKALLAYDGAQRVLDLGASGITYFARRALKYAEKLEHIYMPSDLLAIGRYALRKDQTADSVPLTKIFFLESNFSNTASAMLHGTGTSSINIAGYYKENDGLVVDAYDNVRVLLTLALDNALKGSTQVSTPSVFRDGAITFTSVSLSYTDALDTLVFANDTIYINKTGGTTTKVVYAVLEGAYIEDAENGGLSVDLTGYGANVEFEYNILFNATTSLKASRITKIASQTYSNLNKLVKLEIVDDIDNTPVETAYPNANQNYLVRTAVASPVFTTLAVGGSVKLSQIAVDTNGSLLQPLVLKLNKLIITGNSTVKDLTNGFINISEIVFPGTFSYPAPGSLQGAQAWFDK